MEGINKNEAKVNINYTAEFVKDTKALFEKFPPKHARIFGHHSTIKFRPANLEGIEVGKQSTMRVIGRVYDEKGDALLVENAKSNNKYPHITLSCAEGVSPVYSNELIEKGITAGTVENIADEVLIAVVEGYFDGKNDVVK